MLCVVHVLCVMCVVSVWCVVGVCGVGVGVVWVCVVLGA